MRVQGKADLTECQAAVLLGGNERRGIVPRPAARRRTHSEPVVGSSPMLDVLVELLPLFRDPRSSPRLTGIEAIASDFAPLTSCHLARLEALFLIILPDVAEPLGLEAPLGVEGRQDDGQTSVGMKVTLSFTEGSSSAKFNVLVSSMD